MLIDFHTHIFPEKIAAKTLELLAGRSSSRPFTDGMRGGASFIDERSGVDISVVLPVVTKPSQFDSINAFAAEVNKTPGLISFGRESIPTAKIPKKSWISLPEPDSVG